MKAVQHQLKLDDVTILVADDQDPMRKGIHRILSNMRVGRVVECQDGEDVEAFLADNHADLVVSDIYMRKKSGLDVVRFLRNRNIGSDIPILIVSGEAAKEDVVKAADLGADDYLLKPFQAEDFEKKIIMLLTQYFEPAPIIKCMRAGEKRLMMKDYDGAISYFDQALAIDANSSRARHSKALTLKARGELEPAVALLHETIQLNPSYHKVYGTLADIALQLNDSPNAIQYLCKELELNPKQPDRQILVARLLMETGDVENAIAHFREALKENPTDKRGLLGAGWAFARQGNLEKALYYFKRARRAHPRDSSSLEAVMKICLEANDPKKAEFALIDEKRTHPKRVDTYGLLAKFYVATEREPEAITVLREVTVVAPEHAPGFSALGQIHLKRSEYADATPCLVRAVELKPTAEAYLRLGQCYVEQKQWSGAISNLLQAMVLDRRNFHVFGLLAKAHMETGQLCKAHFLYKRAGRLGPQSDEDKQLMEKCGRGIRARHVHYKKTA